MMERVRDKTRDQKRLFPAEHLVTPFQGFANCGPKSFLWRLLEFDSPTAFGTIIVASVVQHKWKNFAKTKHYIETGIYFASIILAMGTAFVTHAVALQILFGLLGALLLLEVFVEVKMLRSHAHFWSPFTYIRIASIIATSGTIVTYFMYSQSPHLEGFKAMMLYFKWLGFYYYLQPMPLVGRLIPMIVAILFNIKDILFVAAVLIMGLASGLYVLLKSQSFDQEDYRDFGDAVYTTYKMILIGDFIDSQFEIGEFQLLVKAMFILSSFLGTTVILNLLIAKMSNAYEFIQEIAELEHRRTRARIVHKYETLLGRTGGEPWVHVIQPIGKNTPKVESDEWEEWFGYLGARNDEKTKLDEQNTESNADTKQQFVEMKQQMEKQNEQITESKADTKQQFAEMKQHMKKQNAEMKQQMEKQNEQLDKIFHFLNTNDSANSNSGSGSSRNSNSNTANKDSKEDWSGFDC